MEKKGSAVTDCDGAAIVFRIDVILPHVVESALQEKKEEDGKEAKS